MWHALVRFIFYLVRNTKELAAKTMRYVARLVLGDIGSA